MKPATFEKITQVQGILLKRYPNYFDLEPGIRVLLAMSVLANDIKVRETSNNHGEWVRAILDTTDLTEGNPWCAAAIVFCSFVAKLDRPQRFARVYDWIRWATIRGRLKTQPKRGYLCAYLNPDNTGHVGIVAGSALGFVRSYEGNTSPGNEGSQRDGGGLYPRNRRSKVWKFYIDLS